MYVDDAQGDAVNVSVENPSVSVTSEAVPTGNSSSGPGAPAQTTPGSSVPETTSGIGETTVSAVTTPQEQTNGQGQYPVGTIMENTSLATSSGREHAATTPPRRSPFIGTEGMIGLVLAMLLIGVSRKMR